MAVEEIRNAGLERKKGSSSSRGSSDCKVQEVRATPSKKKVMVFEEVFEDNKFSLESIKRRRDIEEMHL